jgi:hypothetical protein
MLSIQSARLLIALTSAGLVFAITSCNSSETQKEPENITQVRDHEYEDMVKRGGYLVTAGGCYDCHTPKKMTAQGPVDDSSRTLSGHPANEPLPPIDDKALTPGNWILLSPSLTAFVGPWGVSFPANLTPDSATGIGAWSEEVFIKTLRTGKHLGQPNGRPILPPMPWFNLARLEENDLKSIYAYLRSLPPISNRVPAPLSPQETAMLAKTGAKATTASFKNP